MKQFSLLIYTLVLLGLLNCNRKKSNTIQQDLDNELTNAYQDKALMQDVKNQNKQDKKTNGLNKDNNLHKSKKEKKYWVDVTTLLRVRNKAGVKDSKVIGSLAPKQEVVFIEKGMLFQTIAGVKGTWLKVKAADGLIGWVFGGFLKPLKDRSFENNTKKKQN